jgi:hypothetical protein
LSDLQTIFARLLVSVRPAADPLEEAALVGLEISENGERARLGEWRPYCLDARREFFEIDHGRLTAGRTPEGRGLGLYGR